MVGKMVTPLLGGTPAVWNTTMVFFQCALLGGYLYTHLSLRWLGARKQALLHLALFTVGALFLPVSIRAPGSEEVLSAPATWLLFSLIFSIGLPFLLLSSSAPLLQRWFAYSDHPDSVDPYFLYSASNGGSFLALLAYPFLIEPLIGLERQSQVWAAGYLLLLSGIALAAAHLWKLTPGEREEKKRQRKEEVSWRSKAVLHPLGLKWIFYALLPSALLLALTEFITTDLAAIPLLWIVPLGLYLLSFMIAFSRSTGFIHLLAEKLFLPALAFLFLLFFFDHPLPLLYEGPVHLLAFLFICTYLHRRLYELRPPKEELTVFYLYLATGGALGGIFVALVAPVLFPVPLEYPLLLAVCLCATRTEGLRRNGSVLVLLAVLGVGAGYGFYSGEYLAVSLLGALFLLLLLVIYFKQSFFLILAPVLGVLLTLTLLLPGERELYRLRTFYGSHQVITDSSGYFHLLYHGRTNHGVQSNLEGWTTVPLAYYHPESPLGEVFDLLDSRKQFGPVGALGLGPGTIAAYSQGKREIRFFEIDPGVVQIARDTRFFTYLEDCGALCSVVVGDGRLTLAREEKVFDLLVLDAYTSSAIPTHLLTREAFQLYFSKLDPERGLVALHISNPYLDLSRPIATLAEELGLVGIVRFDDVTREHPLYNYYAHSSIWVVLARDKEALGILGLDPLWTPLQAEEKKRVWTDDYTNLLGAFRRHR